jgi:tetratricopeptide (TPR) repeat protein
VEPQTVEEVLSLIEERPADADLFQLLGQLYLKDGQLKQSRAAFEQSLTLAPDDPWTHLYLGNWCFRSGKRREALDWFRRAAELLPDEAIVYTCQGDIYKSQGEHVLAEEAFKTAVRIAPDDAAARRKLSEWFEFRYGQWVG